jgi:hypothetical protein
MPTDLSIGMRWQPRNEADPTIGWSSPLQAIVPQRYAASAAKSNSRINSLWIGSVESFVFCNLLICMHLRSCLATETGAQRKLARRLQSICGTQNGCVIWDWPVGPLAELDRAATLPLPSGQAVVEYGPAEAPIFYAPTSSFLPSAFPRELELPRASVPIRRHSRSSRSWQHDIFWLRRRRFSGQFLMQSV